MLVQPHLELRFQWDTIIVDPVPLHLAVAACDCTNPRSVFFSWHLKQAFPPGSLFFTFLFSKNRGRNIITRCMRPMVRTWHREYYVLICFTIHGFLEKSRNIVFMVYLHFLHCSNGTQQSCPTSYSHRSHCSN